MDFDNLARGLVWIYAKEVRKTGALLYEACHVGQRIEVTAALMGRGLQIGTVIDDVLRFALCEGVSHIECLPCSLPIYRRPSGLVDSDEYIILLNGKTNVGLGVGTGGISYPPYR